MSYRDDIGASERKRSKTDKRDKDSRERDRDKYEFTYLDHKHTLEKIIHGYHPYDRLIEDLPDFWKFVKKYEIMTKKAGKTFPKEPTKDSGIGEIKRNCMFIKIDPELRRSHENLVYFDKRSDLTKYRIEMFYDIIAVYLDFKQKEKFNKLEKLRQCQKSLPVYKFKNEILESVEQNQITIIAGDTGCGKSTQIPQYLYYRGFKNIGEPTMDNFTINH